MTIRILTICAALLSSALAGGTLDSGTTTYDQGNLSEGYAYQVSAGGTWAGATITVAMFNHTLGDYVTVTTLTSSASTKRIRATGQKLRATISGGSGTESLAFEALRLPAESAHPTAAELAEIITEDPASALAPTGPAVWVTFASGARIPYKPAADTNAARGDALDAAWTAALATSGAETIDLYPGTFDCARATSTVIAVATQFAVEAGMTVRFNGAKVTHGSSFNGAVIFGADAVDGWSFIGPGIIEGTAATSSGTNEVGINTRTSRRWLIRDLTIRYFRNTGIQANSSSYSSGDYSTGKVSTGRIVSCNIDLNNIGFACYAGSEYISLTACTFNKNLTAADIYAGNTQFTGCEANYNTNYALRIRDGGNDGHGIWNGGSINHNSGFAVAVEANMDNGFTFTGAHLYADSATTNKIQSLGGGVTFSGCIIDSPFYASATPSGNNFVIGCHFPVSAVGAVSATTDLSSAERLKWAFLGNHSLTGGYANNDTIIYRFADDAAAATGGLTAGRQYTDSDTNAVTIKQ